MQAMVSAQDKKDPQARGKNTLGFVEWCPGTLSKTELETAGWRIHVFVDRGINEMEVLDSFVKKLTKEVEKLEHKRRKVPSHYRINTMASYGANIFTVYSGKAGNFEELYQNLSSGCSVSASLDEGN